jgi:hypothetical protein
LVLDFDAREVGDCSKGPGNKGTHWRKLRQLILSHGSVVWKDMAIDQWIRDGEVPSYLGRRHGTVRNLLYDSASPRCDSRKLKRRIGGSGKWHGKSGDNGFYATDNQL